MKLTFFLLPFSWLTACQQSNDYDYRMSWELYVPAVDHNRPAGLDDTTWAVIAGSPKLESSIIRMGAKWNSVLECGAAMKQVDPDIKVPDVVFTCGQSSGRTSSIHNNRLHFNHDTASLTVIINDEDCADPDNMLIRHAIGHALGFADETKWYQTVMGTLDFSLDSPDSGFSPMEIDGFRVWAHEQGAPGCGDKKLPWSWEAFPNMYHAHPAAGAF